MANGRKETAEQAGAAVVDPEEALRRLHAGEVHTEGEAVGLAL